MKRLLKFLGESGFWKLVGRLHVRLYRATGGALGGKLGPLPHLLLTTVGRKSGQARTVPLTYMQDNAQYVLVASNGGSDRHPAWWLNLRESPRADVQVGGEHFEIVASEAQGADRDRLWAAVKRFNPFYVQYEQITSRRIPVVVLRRTS